jgi:sec-independent protein translocase protein TatA
MFEGLAQPMHLILILLIVLVIFGPRKLPELGAGLGKSIREFKKAMKEGQETAAIEKKDGKKA